jgi:hypothetical protein
MDPGVMHSRAASISDLPTSILRQILAAVVHGMRVECLSIVAADARNDDKYWPSLLLYLNLRRVCSGYVLHTCSSS